jgi:ribonuclease P protein component
MPKHRRITRVDFSSVNAARPRRAYGTYFTMSVSPLAAEKLIKEAKFACIVSKKIAVRAVDRNRIRRLCREAFRAASQQTDSPLAFVFYAKKESKTATFQNVASDVKQLLSQIG